MTNIKKWLPSADAILTSLFATAIAAIVAFAIAVIYYGGSAHNQNSTPTLPTAVAPQPQPTLSIPSN